MLGRRHIKLLVVTPIFLWIIIYLYLAFHKTRDARKYNPDKISVSAKHKIYADHSNTTKKGSNILQGKKNDGTDNLLHTNTTTYIDRSSALTTLKTNVTVVTAFFDVGTFWKNGSIVTPTTYFNWASKLRYLQNSLVVYSNSEEFKEHVKHMRNVKSGNTVIRLINITSSWAFQNNNRIKEIFKSPKYPKFHPNTVHSLYACAQHAKYDVMERAVNENRFKTKYIMWLDVGYFRDRRSEKLFYLNKPENFDDSKVAVNLVEPKSRLTHHPHVIFKGNLVWVGGGLVFGDRNHIRAFARDFKRAVQYFLSQGLTNTDQQVIYAMYTTKGREVLKPEVELQLYKPPSVKFYLGNSMVREVDHGTRM